MALGVEGDPVAVPFGGITKRLRLRARPGGKNRPYPAGIMRMHMPIAAKILEDNRFRFAPLQFGGNLAPLDSRLPHPVAQVRPRRIERVSDAIAPFRLGAH